jgi:hypothetical protein
MAYSQYFAGQQSQLVPNASIVNAIAPTFSGVSSAVAQTDGSILAGWSLPVANGAATPIRVVVYIALGASVSPSTLFTGPNAVGQGKSTDTSMRIYQLGDRSTFLTKGQTYTIGARAFSALSINETNTTTINATVSTVSYDSLAAAVWDQLQSAHTAAGSFGLFLDAAISSRASQASVTAIPTNPVLTTDSRLNNLDATISSRLATSGYSAPDNTDVLAIKAKTDNLPIDPASNTQVNTRLAASAYTAPDNADIVAIKAKTDNLPVDPASNTQVNTRLATSSYVAPDNADIVLIKAKTDQLLFDADTGVKAHTLNTAGTDPNIALIKAKTDNLPTDPASNTQVSTRLATSSYVAPDNADIVAIKAKTDNLPVDPASNTQVNTRLATSGYTAPDNTDIIAIKTQTDKFLFDASSFVKADAVVTIDDANIAAIKAKTDNLPSDPASNTQVNTRLATSSYVSPDNADILLIKAKTDNLPVDPASNTQVNTRNSTAHFDAILGTPTGASISADLAEIESETDGISAIPTTPLLSTDTRLNNLDTTISSRLATSGYTAPDNSDVVAIKAKTDQLLFDADTGVKAHTLNTAGTDPNIALIKAKTDNLPSDPASNTQVNTRSSQSSVNAIPTTPLLTTDTRLNNLDAQVSSRLATTGYTAPDNSDVIAIKAKTDLLTFASDGVNAHTNNIPAVDVTAIVSGVWNEPVSGHTTAGTFGENAQKPAINPTQVAAAVWDSNTSAHNANGTFGKNAQTPAIDPTGVANAVWDATASAHRQTGSMGLLQAASGGGSGGGGLLDFDAVIVPDGDFDVVNPQYTDFDSI